VAVTLSVFSWCSSACNAATDTGSVSSVSASGRSDISTTPALSTWIMTRQTLAGGMRPIRTTSQSCPRRTGSDDSAATSCSYRSPSTSSTASRRSTHAATNCSTPARAKTTSVYTIRLRNNDNKISQR